MNLNCAPVVLLVVLCWMFVPGTYAMANSTSTNSTSAAPNTTVSTINATSNGSMMPNATAMPSSNATTMKPSTNATMMSTAATMKPSTNGTMMANATTMKPSTNGTMMANATTMKPSTNGTMMANATTMKPSTNATTPMSSSNSSTIASSNTTVSTGNSSATTSATNSSSAATSASTMTTTVATTTTASPIVPNTTVSTLETNLTRTECRSKRLCAAQPADCNPNSNACFFAGVKRLSGRNMNMEVAGESDGFVCISLKPTSGNETAYICAKDNGKVKFICATLLNGKFSKLTCPVNNVKASVRGKRIQCSFDVTVNNSTSRGTDTTFEMSVQTGSYDATSGELGSPTAQLRTSQVDLTNPTADTNNTITVNSTTTAPATTTAGAVTLQQSLSKALLIILGVVGLAWL